MNEPGSALRTIPRATLLPSRVAALHAAEAALEAGSLVHITGEAGSGRSTFSTRLLVERGPAGRSLRRIVGSPALSEVSFAALAALGMGATESTGEPEGAGTSAEAEQADPGFAVSIARIAESLRSTPHTLLIDDAEYLDDASAGVIAQMFRSAQVAAGEPVQLEVIVVSSSNPAKLPMGLQQLVLDRRVHQVQLEALGFEDARVLLEGFGQQTVNVSTVNRLLNLAGGSAIHLRELALEARAAGAMKEIDGFLTLRSGWAPASQRISTLIARRLSSHPAPIREAVECIAVLGELSHAAATRLMDFETIDQALDEGLLVVTESAPMLDIAQSFDGPGLQPVPPTGERLLRLGSGLTPELVLTGLGRGELRDRASRIRSELPRDALTANARLQLTQHLRRLHVPLDFGELREDTEVAAAAGLSETVIALTDDLQYLGSAATAGTTAPAPELSPELAANLIALQLARADALADLGQAEAALQALAPLLEAQHPDAVMRAARIEFEGLDLPQQAMSRLTDHAAGTPEAAALLALIRARAVTPVHMEELEAAAHDERVSPGVRLSLLSYLATEHVHRGNPGAGVEIFVNYVEGPVWHAAPTATRGELVQAMFFAMLGDGASLQAFDHHFVGIEWANLALDHAAFLAGRGMIFLEAGDASQAAELLGQSAGLLSMRDPARLAGFTAGLDSVAAVMLGELQRAEPLLAKWEASPSVSGGLSRPDAERATLLSTLVLRGAAAARARFESLVEGAERALRPHTLMRLLHDGWRLRLVDSEDERLGLPRLAQVSTGVQGELAALLRGYAAAFADVSGVQVDQLIMAHLGAGRPLYAAEVAARAAELAQRAGNKAKASRLIDLFAQAIIPLGEVNTPSLGRARVDSESLSEREREVCASAASGLSNAEIAAELFLSPRTVEGHLQRAYTKLGVTDRRQLIA